MTAAGSCTLSLVSHGHGALIERLLADIDQWSSAELSEVFVTRNLANEPIRVPKGLAFPVRLIDSPAPRGFGANHNAALALCRSAWFGVLNPDLWLREDALGPLLAEARPGSALLCPRVLEPDGREADSARELPTTARIAGRVLARLTARRPSVASHADAAPAEWFAGMFMLLRTDALRAVGGFDERYFMYCEDVDLCARLRLAGWALQQVRSVSVVHDARRASRRSPRHLTWHLTSLARLWASPAYREYRALLDAERREGAPPRMARG